MPTAKSQKITWKPIGISQSLYAVTKLLSSVLAMLRRFIIMFSRPIQLLFKAYIVYQSNKTFLFLSFTRIWVWRPVCLNGFYNENKKSPSICVPILPLKFDVKWKCSPVTESYKTVVELCRFGIHVIFHSELTFI